MLRVRWQYYEPKQQTKMISKSGSPVCALNLIRKLNTNQILMSCIKVEPERMLLRLIAWLGMRKRVKY